MATAPSESDLLSLRFISAACSCLKTAAHFSGARGVAVGGSSGPPGTFGPSSSPCRCGQRHTHRRCHGWWHVAGAAPCPVSWPSPVDAPSWAGMRHHTGGFRDGDKVTSIDGSACFEASRAAKHLSMRTGEGSMRGDVMPTGGASKLHRHPGGSRGPSRTVPDTLVAWGEAGVSLGGGGTTSALVMDSGFRRNDGMGWT